MGRRLTRALVRVFSAIFLILCWRDAGYSQDRRTDNKPELAVEIGHNGPIQTAIFSPDGRFALTGSLDRTAVLWDVLTGREVRRFIGCPFGITNVAISRDGRLLAAACSDAQGPVIIWELSSVREIMRLPLPYAAIAFSPDSSHLLTGSGTQNDHMIQLWDLQTWQSMPYPVQLPYAQPVSSVGFSTDGKRILISSGGHTFILNRFTKSEELVIPASQSTSRALFSPSGEYILTTSNDTAQLWDANTGAEIRRFIGHSSTIWSAAFSPDGSQIATASWDGTAILWDTLSSRPLHRLRGQLLIRHGSVVSAVAFSPTGEYLLTGGGDGAAILWDARSGDMIRRFEGRSSRVREIDLSKDDRLLATANTDTGATVWDLAAGTKRRVFKAPNDRIISVTLDPKTNLVATASENSAVQLWDLDREEAINRFPGHSGAVNSVVFSPKGDYIATASEDRTVRLWDLRSAQQKETLEHKPWPASFGVRSVKFSQNGQDLLTVISHGKATIWNIAARAIKRTFEEDSVSSALELMTAAYSPDERFVVAGAWDGTIRVWNAGTGKRIGPIIKGHSPWSVNAVSFAPKKPLLMTASFDGTAGLWDLSTGQEIRSFRGHSSGVNSVRASSDEAFIFTGGDDGTARIWNFGTGSELARLVDFRDGTWAVVAPDGRFDTNNLESIRGLHWAMHDDPLSTIPVEIFMRDYYEPRLLSRLLSCNRAEQLRPGACNQQFSRVSELSELNRIQPGVRIVGVQRGASADEVMVDVEVSSKEDPAQTNRKTRTDVYDLRLFRNGQMVGEWPEPRGAIGGPESIEKWRTASRVPMPDGQTKILHRFMVQLPRRDKGKPVKFTSYAFNEDRIKSETASYENYSVPDDVEPAKPRAFVITIGINSYQRPYRNLDFAVKDAKDVSLALRQIKDYEVVPLSLLSEAPKAGVAKPVNQATKANIHEVLGVLAGKSDRTALNDLANADKLRKATPDDLIVMFFSGHGHTEDTGAFYLMPSASKADDSIAPGTLTNFISSEELGEWLREVDAGQMVMILDTCHSAASVDTPGFKPGPMGDRGLGQLAYDKGMQILAASQADDVALELRGLHNGLMTYALREGLNLDARGKAPARRDLAGVGTVTLSQWLSYAEKRTPTLYEDALAGKVNMLSRDSVADTRFIKSVQRRAQTPALFDFVRSSTSPEIVQQ